MKKTLSDLVAENQSIVAKIIEEGGEITPEVEALLNMSEDAIGDKADSYAFIIDRMKLEESYWKEKAAEMTKIAKAISNVQEKLKSRLKDGMLALGTDEVTGHDYKFKLVRGAPKAKILDESSIPATMFEEKVEYKLDKKKLKEALKSGPIEGAVLEEVYSVKIYPNKGGKDGK